MIKCFVAPLRRNYSYAAILCGSLLAGGAWAEQAYATQSGAPSVETETASVRTEIAVLPDPTSQEPSSSVQNGASVQQASYPGPQPPSEKVETTVGPLKVRLYGTVAGEHLRFRHQCGGPGCSTVVLPRLQFNHVSG